MHLRAPAFQTQFRRHRYMMTPWYMGIWIICFVWVPNEKLGTKLNKVHFQQIIFPQKKKSAGGLFKNLICEWLKLLSSSNSKKTKREKKKVFFSFLFIKAHHLETKGKNYSFFFASLPPLPAVENFFLKFFFKQLLFLYVGKAPSL